MTTPIEATLSSAITASVAYNRPSPRCWWCKVRCHNNIAFACTLFPGRTMCSFECARAYILHAVQVCDAERHDLLLHLAEAQLDAGAVTTIGAIRPPTAPWWRNPDVFCAEYCHTCSFEDGHHSGARRRGECACRRLRSPDGSTLAYVVDAATDWPWAEHGRHAPTRVHCHGCFRPCDMSQPTFFAVMHPVTSTDHIPQCHQRFCSARCLRAGLEETQLCPVVRALLIHDSLQLMAVWHGQPSRDYYMQHETQCDWRLRCDFGGPLDLTDWDACTARFIVTHPTMGGGVDPETNTATVVRVTTHIAIIPRAPPDTWFEDDHAAFAVWVRESCAIHESASASLADNADLQSAPPAVREMLMRYPADSPIVKFWLANRDHPKAQTFTLFRKRDLPNTSRTVHMVNASIDDIFE